MSSFLILVKEKTIYVHLEEVLSCGKLFITNTSGKSVFEENISKSDHLIINFNQPEGKYWITIQSQKTKTKKSFHIK